MRTKASWDILLVEDQPGDVHLVKMCMEAWPGLALHTVADAIQAQQFLQRTHPFPRAPVPDLVILDLHMPVHDGTTVLASIRESAALHDTAVVVFTSSRLLRDQALCKKLGANAYVNKPMDWAAWKITIRDLLRKHLAGFSAVCGPG